MTSTYLVCKRIMRISLTSHAEVGIYDNWSPEFCAKQIREISDKIKKAEWYSGVDPNELTEGEAKQLGFKEWVNDQQIPLLLIPLWLFPYLKPGKLLLGSISDTTSKMLKTEEIDSDHRMGLLAYGVVL